MRNAVCLGCGAHEVGLQSVWAVWSGGVYLCRKCYCVQHHRVMAHELNLDKQRRRQQMGIYERMREGET